MSEQEIREALNIKIIEIIMEDFESCSIHFSKSYTNIEIQKYINKNINVIKRCIDDLIDEYKQNNEIHLLMNIEEECKDYIREYLSEYMVE